MLGSARYALDGVGTMPTPTSVSKSWIVPARRLAIYMRDRFTCVSCGLDLSGMPAHMVTLDHVVSRCTYAQWTPATQLEFGSLHKTSNLVTCCNPCNASKKHTDIYKTPGALARVKRAIKRPINMALARSILSSQ